MKITLRVHVGIIQVACQLGHQLADFFAAQYDAGGHGRGRLLRPATQGNLLHLLCDLRRDASRVKIGKAVRLVQLDGILPLCESRDCFDHGAVFDLRLVNAATVDDPYRVAVQKDFGCISILIHIK